MTYVDRGGCDFFGFTSRGAHVAIEAKQCGEERNSLPLWKTGEGFGVKVHQMQHLREVAKAGGFGLIVWKRGENFIILDAMPLDMDCTSFKATDVEHWGSVWRPIGQLADRLEELLSAS